MEDAILEQLRRDLHQQICRNLLGYRKKRKSSIRYLSCADGDSAISIQLAELMLRYIDFAPCKKPKVGQTIGSLFAKFVKCYLEEAFVYLQHIRPGEWLFSASQAKPGIAAFDQYEHLAELQKVIQTNRELAAALGGDYLITPDIVVGRHPIDDPTLNSRRLLISRKKGIACLTPLRKVNTPIPRPILHASISCKWTMRSDRAQNTRTEALNLIRNRKGKTPQICAVTMEPLPTRLSSIAMGTGDVDCTYHVALYELIAAAQESDSESQQEMLRDLVDGRRLRDISDLPFDLAQ